MSGRRASSHTPARRTQLAESSDNHSDVTDAIDRYIALYAQAPVGYVTLDPKGVVLELNAAAANLIGERAPRIVGKPFVCCVYRPDVKLLLQHLLACTQGTASTELRLYGGHGEPRPVHIVSKLIALPGTDGNAYSTVITDLTNLRAAEAALLASESRYREIVETANEGICIVNTQNVIVFANRRLGGMLGLSAADLIGRSVYELIPAEDVEQMRHTLGISQYGSAEQSDVRLQRVDGSLLWTAVSTTAMRDAAGNFCGMLRMFTDISAKRVVAETQESLMRQLVETQERERERIARELHDQMGQHVVALSLGLARLGSLVERVPEASEIVAQLKHLADVLGRDVHTLALELRPAALDHLGLSIALSSYAEQVAARAGLEVDVHCDVVPDLKLRPEQQTAIYRIAQEALSNVVKHAKARRVSVVLKATTGTVQLIVEDDGVGFDQLAMRARKLGKLGLAGMHERAALLGGAVTIESSQSRGTAVYARIPLTFTAANDRETASPAAR